MRRLWPMAVILVRSRGEGDSRFIVFANAHDAVAGAAAMQRRLAAVDWATPIAAPGEGGDPHWRRRPP